MPHQKFKKFMLEALKIYRENLQDADLRNNFLKSFCQFVLSTDEHFYHANDCIESLGIFALDIQNSYLQSVLQKLSAQLQTCKNCIDAFHCQAERYLVHLQSYCSHVAVQEIEKQILLWTITRQCTHLQTNIQKLKACASPEEEKRIRSNAIFLIYELLNFPISFTSSEVDALFVEFLHCCQTNSNFKV